MKRIVIIILIVLTSCLLLAFICISPIAKYVIEKNGERWTGRKVQIEHLWINLFTGSIKISGIKVYEANSSKVFFYCKRFYADLSLHKLWSSEYYLTQVKLLCPQVNIVQKGDYFNYDDIIKRFSDTTTVKEKKASEPVKFFVRNFSIDSATVNYSNTNPLSSVSLLNLAAFCPMYAYNNPVSSVQTAFDLMSGGNVKALVSANSKSLDYNMKLELEKINMVFLYPYLRDYIKIKSLDGFVSSNVSIAGNFNQPADIASSGDIVVTEFSLADTTGETLTSVESFELGIDSLNTKNNIYRLAAITIDRPYMNFAMYKDGYSFERILTPMATDTSAGSTSNEYSNIFKMMADYIKEITQQYVVSNYSADKLIIKNGRVLFTDYTLNDKFQYDIDSLRIASENLSSKNERIYVTMDSRLNRSGSVECKLSVSPDGFRNMDVSYTIKDLLVSDMNPYSKYYVATPFLDGIVLYEDSTSVRDNKLASKNKMQIVHIEAGKKVHNTTAYNLPVRLAVALLKDPHGNINLEIPVEGDLDDPKYRLGKVIWEVIKNIIVKAATAPYKLLANAFGGKEEDYQEIRLDYLQKEMTKDQLKVADNIVKALEAKTELKVELIQVVNKQEEMEQLALLETKENYLGLNADSLSEDALKRAAALSNNDSLFSTWIDGKLNTVSKLNSIQNRCVQYMGKDKLAADLNQLIESRNTSLTDFFKQKNISEDRIKISTAQDSIQPPGEANPKYVINFFVDDAAIAKK